MRVIECREIDGLKKFRYRAVEQSSCVAVDTLDGSWPTLEKSPTMTCQTAMFGMIGSLAGFEVTRRSDTLISTVFGEARVVLLDAREKSPTFGRSFVVEADWRDPHGVLVPAGVGHALFVVSRHGLSIYNRARIAGDSIDGFFWASPEAADCFGDGLVYPIVRDSDRDLPTFAQYLQKKEG